MASCLGLYIGTNVIKYAKVSKDHDILRIESFGMKFYDNLGVAIKQIIEETYSFKIPISINLSEEIYNYFYMFLFLKKNDLQKAIETEFESYCFDKNLNRKAFEGRYALVNSLDDKDKIKVIYISTNKTTLNRETQMIGDEKISCITPISTSITNIVEAKQKENVMVVNIEENTTFTTIVDQKVYDVEKIEEGSQQILEQISLKENSISKAYEICKNSTIYTMEGKELQDEGNEYLDYIMPTLYKIAEKLKNKLDNSTVKVKKIYITGTMSVVNNIDLYFQEFFAEEKCEVLRPYFISGTAKTNIKDYIEVNSAIAIAMQGLGYGIKSMNFKKQSFYERLPDWAKIEIGGENKNNFKFDFSGLSSKFDNSEKWLTRAAIELLMVVVLYSGLSIYLDKSIEDKILEAKDTQSYTNAQIMLAEDDNSKIKQKANRYTELSDNLKNINDRIEDIAVSKDRIPDLLMQIMTIVPQDVQITQIENTSGKHIVIKAQSPRYEQLGYFKAKIKEDNVLMKNTVVSTQGEKDGDFVKIAIEGDMP